MLLTDRTSYLKASNVKAGDTLTFKTAGELIESKFNYPETTQTGVPHPFAGQPKKDFVISVSVKGQDYKMRMNRTNQIAMIEAYGRDTTKWVGRRAVIDIIKVSVKGELTDSIFLSKMSSPTLDEIKAKQKESSVEEMKPEDIAWEE